MKKWQENRNYRRIKNGKGEVVSNIITVDGVDVEVTEEVFLAYSQADRRERYLIEDSETDRQLSLEQACEDGVHLEYMGADTAPSAEHILIEQETLWESERQKARLKDTLETLNDKELALVKALFFDGLSAREYARQLGVYPRAVIYQRDKLLEKLRCKIFL